MAHPNNEMLDISCKESFKSDASPRKTPRLSKKSWGMSPTSKPSVFPSELSPVMPRTKSCLDLSGQLSSKFVAHKEALTTLSFIQCPDTDKKLLTSSVDCYYKIWDLDGTLIASMNINHPLPIVWNLKDHSYETAKKQVLYSLKVIETIYRRYERLIILSEEKKININRFLSKLEQDTPPSAEAATTTKTEAVKKRP